MKNITELRSEGAQHEKELRLWAAMSSDRTIETLTVDPESRDGFQVSLQIPSSSWFGSYLSTFGGIIVNRGQIRLLGCCGNSSSLRDISNWNDRLGGDIKSGFIYIADDVYGNFYGMNLGMVAGAPIGDICALYAEELSWRGINTSFADFISWLLTGDLSVVFDEYSYVDQLWRMHEGDVINGCINFFPPLYTKEGNISGSNKRIIPAHEAMEARLML